MRLRYLRFLVILLLGWLRVSAAPVPPATSPTPFPTLTPSRLPEPPPIASNNVFLDANFRAPRLVAPTLPTRVLALSSGKFLVFFYQSTLANHAAGCVTRYNADGSYDPTFQVTGIGQVYAATELPNHQLIVAGGPNADSPYYSPPSYQVLRLNEDGSVDNSFSSAAVANDFIQYLALAPDGKIVFVGAFTQFAGVAYNNVVRLNASGEIDSSFASPTFGGASVILESAPVVQPDGRILIAGIVYPPNGRTRGYIARLNLDGSMDTSFNPSGFTVNHGLIRGIALLPNGQVVIAGSFLTSASTQGNMFSYFPLLRLNPDGSLDSNFGAFDPDEFGTGYNFYRARDVAMLPNGQFLALITRLENDVDDSCILRFNADGTLDRTFNPPFLRDYYMGSSEFEVAMPHSLALGSNGTIFLAGSLNANRDDTLIRWGVVRLNANGTLTNFAPELAGFYDYPSGAVRFADGKTWITATPSYIPLDFYNTLPNNFAQLDPAGSFDFSFNLAASFSDLPYPVTGIAPLSTGEALAWRYDENTGITYFVRVEENGTVSMSYQPTSLDYENVLAEPDGSILLSAGIYVQAMVNGSLFRIGANGNLDSNFHLDAAVANSQHFYGCGEDYDVYTGIYAIAAGADGKVIISYFAADGLWHIARLNANGSLDDSFEIATTPAFNVIIQGAIFNCNLIADGDTQHVPGNLIQAGALLPDNSVVVIGPVNSFNGKSANGVAHFLPDGTMDSGFDVGLGPQWGSNPTTSITLPAVDSICPVPNGNLLLVGEFDTFSGVAAPGIVMLHRDGSVDTSFISPVERIYARSGTAQLIPQNDGSVLLTGPYSFSGQNFERSVVRLTFDKLPFITSAVSRKTHGDAGTFDIPISLIDGQTVECRSGGRNGEYQVVVTFTNDVVSGNAVITSGTGSVTSEPEFSGNTMSIDLTGIANGQTVGLKLTSVTNTYAQTLPDTTLTIRFLVGDSNGDGAVNAADVLQTRNRSGQSVNETNFRSDLNADGVINSADAAIVRGQSGSGGVSNDQRATP